jgi:natural product biosynthesis luciferase-like monooxygenase protein
MPRRRQTPELSLFYFADAGTGSAEKYRLLLEGARFADANGFAAVWTPERHFHEFGGLYPNPSVTSAALATCTSRVALRAGSVVLPLHDPLRVAEEWSVVDNLSGGRVGISFAPGWLARDFVLAPATYAGRREVMEREVATVRRLWRGETIMRQGGDGEPVEVTVWPRPVQDELPVWLTSSGSAETFALAGRLGAGVLTHLLGQSLEDVAAKIAAYRRAWTPVVPGTRPHATLMLHTLVGDDEREVRELVRDPLSAYLRSSVGLWASREDVQSLTEEDLDAVIAHAFDRYFEHSGLFGTRATAAATIERIQAAGVDEIACLVDFGVEVDVALAGLERLAELPVALAA